MKLVKIYFLFFIAAVCFMHSCDKKDLIAENDKWIFADTSDVGYVRLIHSHAAVAPQIPTAAANTGPQVFVYANGQKLNGNALSYGGNWPSPNVYATIPTGNVNFTVVMARLNTLVTPNVPAPIAGDTILKYTQAIEKGKSYSMILVDTFPAMKAFTKEDDLTLPALDKYRIRLINTTANPLDTVSLYSRNLKQFIITDIKHKETSKIVELNVPTINDTLEVRKPNGTVALYFVGSQTAPQAFAPISQRIYTVVCRGKTGLTTKTPSASLVVNR
jgi:hypothetical protein